MIDIEHQNDLFLIARLASTRTLEAYGVLSKTLTRAQVIRVYDRSIFDKSRQYVTWQKKGDGKNSKLTCSREEFEKYILKFDLELKEIR